MSDDKERSQSRSYLPVGGPRPGSELDRTIVNTIRGLVMDAVQKANPGHPGMPMGMAEAACILWNRFPKHNPAEPTLAR